MTNNFQVVKNTKWFNPTENHATFKLYVGLPRLIDGEAAARQNLAAKKSMGPWLSVSIAPGETVEIPSEYDSTVQTVVNGRIVGGKAPTLINKTLEKPPKPDPMLSDTEVEIPDPRLARINSV